MSAWLGDLRLAVRALRATPSFTCLAALLLALSIAAATTLFSIANAVLFRPFPFADQERLVIAGEDQLVPRSEVSYRDVEDWRAGTHVFEDLCAISSTEWTWDLRTNAETVAVRYRSVGGNFFDLLGATPLLGRTVHPDDDHLRSRANGRPELRFLAAPVRRRSRHRRSHDRAQWDDIHRRGDHARDVRVPCRHRRLDSARAGSRRPSRVGIPNGPIDILDVGVLFALGRLKPDTSIDAARKT